MTLVRARWVAGLATVAAVGGLAVLAPPAVAAVGEVANLGSPNSIKNSFIVTLNEGVARTKGVHSAAGELAGRHAAKVEHTYQHAVRGFAATMSEADARRLAADPAVARVEANVMVKLAATQFGPPSWGLDRVDQRVRPYNGSYTYPNAGAGVRAYVIDTGIRTTHVDFGGRAIFGANTVGGPNTDCNGHGTHVAGTVGGAAFGVAKAVALTAVKVLDCGGFGSAATIIAGVDWVTGNHVSGPAVANMSLGFTGAVPALENAVRNSINDGIVYAIASGNSASDACNFSPARTLEAITVNATDINDVRAGFSNFGACTDIFAPGVQITSAWATSDTAVNRIDGTSMATPHVAGAAALILAANPALNPQQVAAVMYSQSTVGIVANPGPGSPNRMLFVAHPTPPAPAPGPDHLIRGQALTAGQQLVSGNGLYRLVMQGDGNLVLYNQINQALWHLGTFGNPGAFLVFQGDGNVVLYRANGTPLWQTVSYGTAANNFLVQNDSNIVLYGPAGQFYWHRLQ
jgi:subtilisin family serine protease